MFRVADNDFDVVSAQLELFDRSAENVVCWGVRIIGKSRGGDEGVPAWNPAIMADVLLETQPGQIASWHDIGGTTVRWDEPNDDPQALFEVYETQPIYNCTVQFVKDGERIRLLLKGMVYIDSDYQDVAIELDTPLTIAPWPMGDDSEQQCLARYAQLGFTDPVEFRVIDDVSSLVFLNQ
jgi:hypothetical protein